MALGELLISEAFEMYRTDYIVFKNQSLKTEENHIVCGRALETFFGDIHITSLTFPMIRNWKSHLCKKRSDSTVRNYIIKLRVVLSYLQKRGYSVLEPDTIPVPERGDTIVEYVTPHEINEMLYSFEHLRISELDKLRSRAIISMLYGSALRLSELISLNKSQIIEDSFTVIGKGRKARLCFVDERTSTLLDEYLPRRTDNHPALFYSPRGQGRMVSTNIQVMVKAAARRAGIERHVTPHTLRHAYATDFTRNGGNTRHLQVILGHNSLATTALYAHVVDEDLRKSVLEHHSV